MSSTLLAPDSQASSAGEIESLRIQIEVLEERIRAGEQRRRAMLHIMGDLAESNKRLNDQRRAMLHILVDYERERKVLAKQTESLENSRKALMHILRDAHESNVRLGLSRKAMIHIMGDLRNTTEEMKLREKELHEKQEQLIQTAKLATLGELTTGVAHELNNPLNNIGLYVGNILDRLGMGLTDPARTQSELNRVMQQVRKATEIISHLRTFGRAAPSSRNVVNLNDVVESASSLLKEQLRLRDIELSLDLSYEDPCVLGNAIQLEQVLMNLLTNARDALETSEKKAITIETEVTDDRSCLTVTDTGPGIPAELAQRIFDPFFTTKEPGDGTGLGLSIVYGIINDHGGEIKVSDSSSGARFTIELPLNRGGS